MLLALLAGPTIAFAAHLVERFANPYAPYYVEREVRDTAEWVQRMMRRAMVERRDFVLELYGSKPNPRIRARWANPSETVERESDRIAYLVKRTDSAVQEQFHFSHRYQTMSPAFELEIHAQTPESGVTERTEWGIVVSLYGHVRISNR